MTEDDESLEVSKDSSTPRIESLTHLRNKRNFTNLEKENIYME